jgi:dihydrofolate reductase
MGKVIVVEFVTADGVIEDPDGSGGTPAGGWAFHAGPEVFAGDKFDVGAEMASGVLLLGRTTWEMFSTRWPTRTGGFADLMNSTPKVVASRSLEDVSAWSNSSVMKGDLEDALAALTSAGDVVVVGSTSVVHALAASGLVDQYRVIVIPTVVGAGTRLFPAGARPTELALTSAEQRGPTVLLQYDIRR